MCRPISSRLSGVASLLVQSFSTSSSSAVGGKTFIFSLLTGRLEALGVATSKNELKTTSFQDMANGRGRVPRVLDIGWGASREVFAPAKPLPRRLATGDLLISPKVVGRSG